MPSHVQRARVHLDEATMDWMTFRPVSKSFQANRLGTHGARGSQSLGLRSAKIALKKLTFNAIAGRTLNSAILPNFVKIAT